MITNGLVCGDEIGRVEADSLFEEFATWSSASVTFSIRTTGLRHHDSPHPRRHERNGGETRFDRRGQHRPTCRGRADSEPGGEPLPRSLERDANRSSIAS